MWLQSALLDVNWQNTGHMLPVSSFKSLESGELEWSSAHEQEPRHLLQGTDDVTAINLRKSTSGSRHIRLLGLPSWKFGPDYLMSQPYSNKILPSVRMKQIYNHSKRGDGKLFVKVSNIKLCLISLVVYFCHVFPSCLWYTPSLRTCDYLSRNTRFALGLNMFWTSFRSCELHISFILPWVAHTQLNHWTKRMMCIRLITYDPRNYPKLLLT